MSLSVPGRPVLDLLDGCLESKDTVEVSLVSDPVFFFLFLGCFLYLFFSLFNVRQCFIFCFIKEPCELCIDSNTSFSGKRWSRCRGLSATTVCVAISTSFLASGNESLLCILNCWNCFQWTLSSVCAVAHTMDTCEMWCGTECQCI